MLVAVIVGSGGYDRFSGFGNGAGLRQRHWLGVGLRLRLGCGPWIEFRLQDDGGVDR